jgi:hypothetical protein
VIPFFHPAAEAEHLETVAFYDSRQAGLGDAYLADFERTLARIVEGPMRHRIERAPNIRRISLAQFPLSIVYRDAGESIQLLAVSHKRRRPGYWVGRL